MSTLRQVKPDYDPGYPSRLSQQEVIDLLRPGLFARFSSKTMLAGAMLAGATLSGCGAGGKVAVAAEGPARPVPQGPTTKNDPALKAKVDQLVTELLGPNKSFWNEHASLSLHRTLAANPPVKYPSIPISYGNSYVGIFDTEAARTATLKLFTLYGIELKSGVSVEGTGFKFEADGYDEKTGIGFKLIMPGDGALSGRQQIQKQPPEKALDTNEIKPLDRAIAKEQIHIFAAEAAGYPNMDGDLYTPMEYYLASVVDYLNWIHGDRQIELTTVLGKLPGDQAKQAKQRFPALPGCDFEAEDDLANWEVSHGTRERSDMWASFGKHSLLLKLEPGGEATYTVPDGQEVLINQSYASISSVIYVDKLDEPVTLRFTLNGEDGKTANGSEIVDQAGTRKTRAHVNKPPFSRLKTLKISANNKQPLTLFIDDISVTLQNKDQ